MGGIGGMGACICGKKDGADPGANAGFNAAIGPGADTGRGTDAGAEEAIRCLSLRSKPNLYMTFS